jgi:peroxiredoxin
MLHTRQIIPPLTLHALSGCTVRAWDFKQKKNLVDAFLGADCAECAKYVRRIAAHAADRCEREGVALLAFLEAPA